MNKWTLRCQKSIIRFNTNANAFLIALRKCSCFRVEEYTTNVHNHFQFISFMKHSQNSIHMYIMLFIHYYVMLYVPISMQKFVFPVFFIFQRGIKLGQKTVYFNALCCLWIKISTFFKILFCWHKINIKFEFTVLFSWLQRH